MPPLAPVPNVLKVVVNGAVTSSQPYVWANVLHLGWTGTTPTAAAVTAIATGVMNAWSSHVSPLQSSQVSADEVTVTDLTSNTAAEGSYTAHTPGTRGDEFLAGNVAALVSYAVSVRYRGGHPRTYLLAGQQPDLADTGHWLSTFANLVTTDWQAFLNAILALSSGGTSISGLVAVSYIDKNLNPVPPYRRTTPLVIPLTVSTAICQNEVASQRRRIGRRRR